MPVKIKDKETGEITQREVVDAREILAMNSERYELVPTEPGGPQNMEHTVEEFRRHPVGANVPKERTDEDDVVKIRNPITDQPRMAMPPGVTPTNPELRGAVADRNVVRDQLQSMTVEDLRTTAEAEGIDLGDARLKDDIVKVMTREKVRRAKSAPARAAASPLAASAAAAEAEAAARKPQGSEE